MCLLVIAYIVRPTVEDSRREAREEKNARKCATVGEVGEKKQPACTDTQLSSCLEQIISNDPEKKHT